MISFEIRLYPDDSAMTDFDGWLDAQKARLEAVGLVVTEVAGASFTGFYDPETVDASVFDMLES